MVEELLQKELLILTTPRSQRAVESRLALLLSQEETTGADIADALMEMPAVSELFADDDVLEALASGGEIS